MKAFCSYCKFVDTPTWLLLFFVLLMSFENNADKRTSITLADTPDCAACDRINLFIKSKEIVSNNVWNGLNTDAHTRPLLYFTDSITYVAFADEELFVKYNYQLLECGNGFSLLKMPRLDKQPFHMENKMSFSDTSSLYYNQPMMLCSDVETLIKVVPDFNKTEDWLQLVMHEYFHSFQFSHRASINYLADTVQMSADTLNKIYVNNSWFSQFLEKENNALLNAIRVSKTDSMKLYITQFLQARKQRRMKYESGHRLNLSVIENFWETIEGTARYTEYYMAGNFHQMANVSTGKCDSLFKNFEDYNGRIHFESKREFLERTKIMQAYYYVTGFNLCRLMDKMGINYKQDLFNNPTVGLYEIFIKNAIH